MPDPSVVDVLVVDDNDSLLDLSARALRRAGVVVATANNLEQLDAALAATTPRLVLMDVQMPELFGDDVASTLRHVRGLSAKIYLYSSLDDEQLIPLARNAGVDGWISKNAGITHLVDEVRRLLG